MQSRKREQEQGFILRLRQDFKALENRISRRPRNQWGVRSAECGVADFGAEHLLSVCLWWHPKCWCVLWICSR